MSWEKASLDQAVYSEMFPLQCIGIFTVSGGTGIFVNNFLSSSKKTYIFCFKFSFLMYFNFQFEALSLSLLKITTKL